MSMRLIDGRYVSDAEWFQLLFQMARDDEPERPREPETLPERDELFDETFELEFRRDWPEVTVKGET